MTVVHINFTRYTETVCQLNRCPTCQRDRRMLGQFQEWYGMTWTCLGCGEQWQDGEHGGREFRPGWRQENIRHARKVLESIGAQA
jgi:hypothetical protein